MFGLIPEEIAAVVAWAQSLNSADQLQVAEEVSEMLAEKYPSTFQAIHDRLAAE